jgi:hypothetical protein
MNAARTNSSKKIAAHVTPKISHLISMESTAGL